MPLTQSSLTTEPGATPFADIAEALLNGDAEQRRAAAQEATTRANLSLLVEHLEYEPDVSVREAIFNRIARTGDSEVIHELLKLLRSEDIGLRNAVIETVQAMGEMAIPELVPLLIDADPDVRIFTVTILQTLRSPLVVPLALGVIADDSHANVCAAAVDILAESGGPDAAPALHGLAARFPGDPFLAFAVRSALKRIG